MLQLNRLEPPQYGKELVFDDDDWSGTLFGATFWNQYLLVLGEFGFMHFQSEHHHQDQNQLWLWTEDWLVTIYFLGTTFITQVVILNMLIAIMGNTFGKQIDDLEMKSKQQKLNLQAEYAGLVEIYDDIFTCCGRCAKKKKKNAWKQ